MQKCLMIEKTRMNKEIKSKIHVAKLRLVSLNKIKKLY